MKILMSNSFRTYDIKIRWHLLDDYRQNMHAREQGRGKNTVYMNMRKVILWGVETFP